MSDDLRRDAVSLIERQFKEPFVSDNVELLSFALDFTLTIREYEREIWFQTNVIPTRQMLALLSKAYEFADKFDQKRDLVWDVFDEKNLRKTGSVLLKYLNDFFDEMPSSEEKKVNARNAVPSHGLHQTAFGDLGQRL